MRLLGLIGFVLLLGAASTNAAAQPNQPRIEVRLLGWQSDAPLNAGTWNPVVVRVTGGDSTEQAARLQVVLKTSFGNGPEPFVVPLAAYAQDVALPPGVTKDVKIWVTVPGADDETHVATVQLLGSGGQVLAEQSVTARTARGDVPVLASLADTSTLAAQLARIEVPYQQGLMAQVRTLEMAPADLPSNAQYLSAIRGLAVQGSAAALLTREQRRAVMDWVTLGGHLLIAGGPDGSRAASILDTTDRLPVRFSGVENAVDLQPLAAWASTDSGSALGLAPVSRIDMTAGQRLVGTTERPLVMRATLGDGSVTLLAADPSLDPLRGWNGTPALLKRAMEPALRNLRPPDSRSSPDVQPMDSESRLIGALDALPPQVFPDWQHVGMLLGGFALLAGPLLHVVLWRADRRPWLWVAVPVLSVGFTAAIYVIAGIQPGRDVVANVVGDVRLDPSTGEARQTLAVAFFAPLRDQLTVRTRGETPVRAFLGSSNAQSSSVIRSGSNSLLVMGMGGRTGDRVPQYRVTTGRDTQIEFLANPLDQGGQRSVVLRRTLPSSTGRIESDLRIEGRDGLIRGSIHNATPFDFEQVGLLIDQTLVRVGPLASDQTTAVSFDPRATAPKVYGDTAYSYAWQMFGIPPSVPRASGMNYGDNLVLPDDPDIRRRVRVMEVVLGERGRFGYGPSSAYMIPGTPPVRPSAPTPPTVVALSTASIGADLLPTSGAERTFQLNVLQQPVQVGIAPGPFTIPPPLLRPAVSADPGASLSNGGYPAQGLGWVDLTGGAAVYAFHADLPTGARVDRLQIRTQQNAPATAPTGIAAAPGSGGSFAPTPAPLTFGGPSTPGPSVAGTFSVFNWQTSAWEPLAAGQQQADVAPAAPFVGPDGTVRVQVSSAGPNRTVRFLMPELSMLGEVPR